MKTAVYYFSGTGNTERVVNAWMAALAAEGVEGEAFRIESFLQQGAADAPKTEAEKEAAERQMSGYDRIGIAYPIHAFNAPEIVLDFAEALPVFPEKKEFYLIMVGGEPLRLNDSSDQKLRKILKKKNARVESRWHYIMPYNMIFRHTEAKAFQMNRAMEELVPLDVRGYFREGKKNRLRPIPGTSLLTAAFRIEQVFSHINGKHFRITSRCVQCMQCVQNCPTQNIEYAKGTFRFHDRCILCTRCSFSCPVDAIRIGLLNNWRVNGPYRFLPPEQEEADPHAGFCRKSYARYFRNAEARVRDDVVRPETLDLGKVLPALSAEDAGEEAAYPKITLADPEAVEALLEPEETEEEAWGIKTG